MKNKLTKDDITFIKSSSKDKSCKLFLYDGNLYRGITEQSKNLYEMLFKNNHQYKLFDLGLVETEIDDTISVEGYSLILKHKKIPFVSYPTEWCGEMYKDAAITTLRINDALAEFGLELKDAHPWNILFDGCRPIFVDFGSLSPIKKQTYWLAKKEFLGTFYNPLRLFSIGCPEKARKLIVNQETLLGKRISNMEIVQSVCSRKKIKYFFPTLKTSLAYQIFSSQWDNGKLLKEVEMMSIPIKKTNWSEYYKDEVDLNKVNEWITKRKTVFKVISRCNPESVLDVGSNTGWFSKLSSMLGALPVAFDNDESCINKLYLAEKQQSHRILPLLMDFRNPSLAYGIDLHCRPAVERLKCDMVLALALVHHLVFKQNETFNRIIGSLSAFTKKWLLIEFIPKEDKYVSEWYSDKFSWYNVENFEMELRKYFSKIERLPSNPDPRLMFLCQT